jgi:hypothetical protein
VSLCGSDGIGQMIAIQLFDDIINREFTIGCTIDKVNNLISIYIDKNLVASDVLNPRISFNAKPGIEIIGSIAADVDGLEPGAFISQGYMIGKFLDATQYEILFDAAVAFKNATGKQGIIFNYFDR